MRKQIVRFSYRQNTKFAVIFYAFCGLIYVPIGLALMLFGPQEQRIGAVLFIFMPIVSAIFGGIAVPVMITIYNSIAKVAGEIEYSTEETDT